MRKYLLILLGVIAVTGATAQAPVITSVQPLSAGPTQKIVITGNGFNTTPALNLVWFDHVKGTVTKASAFSLEVQVPPQAHLANVQVTNVSNFLSAKSRLKFVPSYGGVSFLDSAAVKAKALASAYSSTDAFELFDIASSDFDLDGKPDLVTTRGGPTSAAAITDIYVYQNTSSGIGNINFTKFDKTSIPALNVTAPTANVAAEDLNGDGKPDIVATGGGTKRNQVFVIKNNNTVTGTLAFVASTTLILPPPDPLNPNKNAPLSFEVACRDLNGDGLPEIVVTNAQDDSDPTTDNRIYVFQNTSSGGTLSFNPTPIQLFVTGASSTYGLELQDIDGDSMTDIIVNQFFSSNIFVLLNTSSGNISFAPVQKISAIGSLTSLKAADLNNDGKFDLIGSANIDNNIQIWMNQSTQGNVAFGSSQTIATDVGPWGVEVSDIDGDGDTDLVVANKSGSTLTIIRQDAGNTFTKLYYPTTNNFSRNLRVGDYDGDAKPDVIHTGIPANASPFSLNGLRNINCWAPVITSSVGTTSPQPICAAQQIRLQIKPALGVNYTWKLNGSATQPTMKDTLLTAAGGAGTYTVTLNGTVDSNCTNISPGFVLNLSSGTAPANPQIKYTPPCVGTALNLSTDPVSGGTFKWTGPASFTSTVQNPVINPTTNSNAGLYTLQVTVGLCESNITSQQLDVASVPTLPVTANAPTTACVGASTTLSVTGSGYTYQWKKNSSAISGQTNSSLALNAMTASDDADYSVVVTSISNLCSQETAKTTVKVFAKPNVSFTVAPPLCKGDSIQFTNGVTGNDPRGTLVYNWTFEGTQTSTKANPKHVYASAGNYSPNLTAYYSGVAGCSNNSTQPLSIVAPVVPVIQTTANPICLGDPTTLSISGSFTSINWVGVSGTGSSVIITVPDSLYKVLTVDANGCASKDSLRITSKPLIDPFDAKATKSSITLGDTTKLTATTGADTYTWNHGKTLSDSTIANPVAKPIVTTTYVVIAVKAGYCTIKDSVTVSVETGATVDLNAPVLFSPNNDGKNDTWKIDKTQEYADWTMTIFDGHGSQVYQRKDYFSYPWDGGSAPEGVYYYVFSNSKGKPTTGSVLLVRQKP